MKVDGPRKADVKKDLPTYNARPGMFEVVNVAPQQFLMVDGEGDPNTAASYADAVASMYPLAYATKFLSKNELNRDYVVPPLEALWWSENMAAFTTERDPSQWCWRVMLLLPEWLGPDHLAAAEESLRRKGVAPTPDAVRRERFDEGLAVQTLHVGNYDAEGPVLQRMHNEIIPAEGLHMTGMHHEIYLSDPRRVAPNKLKTILRQPVIRLGDKPS